LVGPLLEAGLRVSCYVSKTRAPPAQLSSPTCPIVEVHLAGVKQALAAQFPQLMKRHDERFALLDSTSCPD